MVSEEHLQVKAQLKILVVQYALKLHQASHPNYHLLPPRKHPESILNRGNKLLLVSPKLESLSKLLCGWCLNSHKARILVCLVNKLESSAGLELGAMNICFKEMEHTFRRMFLCIQFSLR